MSDEDYRTRTDHTKPCPFCGKLMRWWTHPPDAINPVGLWYHETEEDEDACQRLLLAR